MSRTKKLIIVIYLQIRFKHCTLYAHFVSKNLFSNRANLHPAQFQSHAVRRSGLCYRLKLFNKGSRMRRQELHPRTAVINKVQKNKSKQARNEALLWLAATFPQIFDNTLRIRPLKVGIMDDILAHADKAMEAGISKSKLREAVVLFTRRIDYLTCLKTREMRVDLEGSSVTIVTEEEAEKATAKIKKRVEKSARNARKNLAGKIPSHYSVRPSSQPNFQASQELTPHHYPERAPAFSAQSATSQASRATAVVVKHKTSRQFDPDAVARLKEKLGLSRKIELQKETVE